MGKPDGASENGHRNPSRYIRYLIYVVYIWARRLYNR